MTTMLEKAARAAWEEIARQNDENSGGYAGSGWGSPHYVDGKIDPVSLARAVLLAVRVEEPVYMIEQRFNDRIDSLLNEDPPA